MKKIPFSTHYMERIQTCVNVLQFIGDDVKENSPSNKGKNQGKRIRKVATTLFEYVFKLVDKAENKNNKKSIDNKNKVN